MDRTSAQPQVNLGLLRSNYLKFMIGELHSIEVLRLRSKQR
jgi:hypothetical protein